MFFPVYIRCLTCTGQNQRRMNKTDRLIIYAGAAGLAYWFYSKGRALSNLVFTPGPVSGIQMVNGGPVLSLNISVQNTSSASLQINSLAANVISNGSLVGNVYNFLPTTVPANAQIFMPVLIRLETIVHRCFVFVKSRSSFPLIQDSPNYNA